MSGKLGNYFLFFFLFISCFCFAQVQIKGKLHTVEKDSISYQGILVILLKEGIETQFKASNVAGEFEFILKEKGNYQLKINDFDFESEFLDFSLDNLELSVRNLSLPIHRKSVELSQISISNKKIEVKNDTIVFDAKAFSKGNEKVVEDLLKNIPGLEIDASGTIKVNGKEVEKVMIEGDDFFEKGYKMITQNMPAQPISKVEVLQNYSHNALLKGFEESDKVALNLKLSNKFKNTWFGEANLIQAVYPENNYKIFATLLSIGKSNKHFFMLDANDIGENRTGDITQLYRTSNTLIGDQIQNPYFFENSNVLFGLSEKRYNFNQSKVGSLNSILQFNDRIKIKPKISLKWDNIRSISQTKNFYYLNNDTLRNVDYVNSEIPQFFLNTSFEITNQFNESTNFVSTTNYSKSILTPDISNNFNEVENQSNYDLDGQTFDQKFQFTHKLNQNSVYLFNLRYLNKNNQEHLNYNSTQNIFPDAFPEDDSRRIEQDINRELNYIGFESKWIYKNKKDKLFETEFNYQFLHNDLQSQLNLNNQSYQDELAYQNDAQMAQNQLGFDVKFSLQILPKLKWNNVLGLGWVHFTHKDWAQENRFESLYPKINSTFNWNPTSKHTVKLGFQHSNGLIDQNRFYRNRILKNRTFENGFTNNSILPTYGISLKYDYGNFFDKLNFGIESGYRHSDKYIASQRDIFETSQNSNYLLLRNKKDLMSGIYLSNLFDFFDHNVKISVTHNYSEFENYINSFEKREVRNSGFNYRLEFNSLFENTPLHYNLAFNWQSMKYNAGGFEQEQDSFKSMLLINYPIQQKIWIKSETEWYYFPNFTQNKSYIFSDFMVYYDWKKYNLSLSFELRNLTNTKSFENTFVTDYFRSTYSYEMFPRMLLLGASFKF